MVTFEQAKSFLKVDTDEDDGFIRLAAAAATEYVEAATGRPPDCARADILVLFLMSDMYENRTFAVGKDDKEKGYLVRSMITQLSLEGGGMIENSP